VVFIVGLEKDIVPYIRDDEVDREAALEEERRLLYVGMTRAKKRLYLTWARRRFLFGRRGVGLPSPFLDDISDDLVLFVKEKTQRPRKSPSKKNGSDRQLKLF
jgi:DNA helicase-2/ATP-dependent DNA helicase PcrA